MSASKADKVSSGRCTVRIFGYIELEKGELDYSMHITYTVQLGCGFYHVEEGGENGKNTQLQSLDMFKVRNNTGRGKKMNFFFGQIIIALAAYRLGYMFWCD